MYGEEGAAFSHKPTVGSPNLNCSAICNCPTKHHLHVASPAMAAQQNVLDAPPCIPEYQVPIALHVENRNRVVSRLRNISALANGFVLMQGGCTTTRYDTDTEVLFRQESNFQCAAARKPSSRS